MTNDGAVVVEIIDLKSGREIGLRDRRLEDLHDHLGAIKNAVVEGAKSLAGALGDLPSAAGWEAEELSATFGLTLTAEAGVLVSKATAGASMEITVVFRRSGHASH